MTGRLYGVGLGPGDPELITLKAARLIRAARVVAYPALTGHDSFARRIAAGLIAEGTEEIAIEMEMTQARAPAQAAYDAGAAAIAGRIRAGQDVVCLCEGDPLFYGSFMYLYARLSKHFPVEVVPGVSALTAVAARAGRPLAARNGALTVLPGPLPDAVLAARVAEAGSAAILKVGCHLPRLRTLAAREGWLESAVYVAHATLPDEQVLPLAQAPDAAPYFSMILVTRERDPWL